MSRQFHLIEPRHPSHERFSGPPQIRRASPAADPAGHRRYSDPAHVHRGEDRNAETLARIARWRLYADCDRAPLDWEKRA